MFKKPFRVKSQIQLKTSEKKKFSSEIQQLFPSLTSEDVAQLCGNKENIVKTKIVTHNEELVDVYLIDKIPIFFDVVDQNIKLPSVYMCWKYPHIVTRFTTNTVVLDKLKNGADLFLPGVYQDTVEFRNRIFHEKDPAAVNLITNAAAFAVGQCLMSKKDAIAESSLMDGRLLKVFHCVGDHLCKSYPQPVPNSDPPERISADETSQLSNCIVMDSLEIVDEGTEANGNDLSERKGEEQLNNIVSESGIEMPSNQPLDNREKMDQLLTYCFIKSVKIAPKSVYPILPAAFYANHIIQAVPPGESLNVKKTKWKKFSGLLQEMASYGVVQLETVRANEYKIVAANSSHPMVREFIDPFHTPVTVDATPSRATTSVQEVFVVTAPTQPLFVGKGLQKGDEITRLDVRSALTEYIRNENLAIPETPDIVRLNNVLQAAVKDAGETKSRMELLAAVLAVMPLRHKISSGGDLITHKANLPLIDFDVVVRSGNKKVTLISNVEGYGVDVTAFARALQHAAAASTTVTSSVPGKKGPQVQVQGNQVIVASRLLTENHGIAEKYMRGLEKAPKSKRK